MAALKSPGRAETADLSNQTPGPMSKQWAAAWGPVPPDARSLHPSPGWPSGWSTEGWPETEVKNSHGSAGQRSSFVCLFEKFSLTEVEHELSKQLQGHVSFL